MNRLFGSFTIAFIIAFASVASAEAVYSNLFTDDTTFEVVWYIVDLFDQQVTDDFQINTGNATVTDVQFWITIGSPSQPPTKFVIQFYESNSSQNAPGNLIQESVISSFSLEPTGFSQVYAPVYEVNLSLPPENEFQAAQGVRYWIAFMAVAASSDDYRIALAMDEIPIGKQANIWITDHWVTAQSASGGMYGPADGFFALYGDLENSLESYTCGSIKSSF